MRLLKFCVLTLLLPWLVGCEAAPSLDASVPALKLEETLRIGSVDESETSLTFISDLEVDRDGSIISVHPMESIVRLFSPNGLPTGTIGGPGDGPEEFRSPVTLGWKADSVWVRDAALRRIAVIHDGQIERSIATNFSPDIGRLERGLRADGLFPDGTFLASDNVTSAEFLRGNVSTIQVVRVDRSGGEVLAELLERPFGPSTWFAIRDPSGESAGVFFTSQPLQDYPIHELSSDDSSVIQVHRKVNGRDTPTFRVLKVSAFGDTIWDRQLAWEPEELSEGTIDSLVSHYARLSNESRGARAPNMEQQEQWVREALYTPEYLPAVDHLVVAPDGRFVVTHPGDPPAVTLVSSQGTPIGRGQLPLGVQLLALRDSSVYGVVTDELDVPYIVRYSLTRREVP